MTVEPLRMTGEGWGLSDEVNLSRLSDLNPVIPTEVEGSVLEGAQATDRRKEATVAA